METKGDGAFESKYQSSSSSGRGGGAEEEGGVKGKTQNTRLDVLKGYECDRKAKLSSHDGGHLHRPQERKPRITRSEDVSTWECAGDVAGPGGTEEDRDDRSVSLGHLVRGEHWPESEHRDD